MKAKTQEAMDEWQDTRAGTTWKKEYVNEMFVIEAEKAGERTRFCVGCFNQSLDVELALRVGGFEIAEVKVKAPPVRSEEEKQRASRILSALRSGLST